MILSNPAKICAIDKTEKCKLIKRKCKLIKQKWKLIKRKWKSIKRKWKLIKRKTLFSYRKLCYNYMEYSQLRDIVCEKSFRVKLRLKKDSNDRKIVFAKADMGA